MSSGLLAGVRVLDLSRVLAAPYATMALGDLGADVIKVERAPDGDETRQWGPPFVAGESTYFLGINRNKRSIALDLKAPHDQQIIRDLALNWADVVVENFRPGTLEGWDLGLADLRRSNDRLITATVRGYPPGDDRPGYDFVIQAGTGLMSITGPSEGPPSKVGVAVADITTGLFLLGAVTAALYRRERTGRGEHVCVSLWESELAQLATVVQGYLSTGMEPRRWGNAHAQLAPYQTFSTKDGWIAVGVGNDGQFAALCETLGGAVHADDPRFATNPERVTHRDELEHLLNQAFAQAETAVWVQRLEAKGVPVGPVRTVPQALRHASEKGHELFEAVHHHRLGKLEQLRLPWHFDENPTTIRRPPPTLDEHRLEILALVQQIRAARKDDQHNGGV
jgi:crotonobetainyl-CoA:carnitine CoA-transferase CaiB-like acyl-CoA transferase